MGDEPLVGIVDDDADLCRAMETLVTSVGLNCRVFGGGVELLDELPSGPGCILLDLRMPVMSGQQVLEQLDGRIDVPPVIMMSGVGEVDDAVRAMKAGAFDYLEKPPHPSKLIDAVQRAVAASVERQPMLETMRQRQARLDALTQQEREVMRLIVAGHPNKGIARTLGLSQRTVEFHRGRLMRKMNAANVAELVRMVLAPPLVGSEPDGAPASSSLDGSAHRARTLCG